MTVPNRPKLSDVIAEFGQNGNPKNLRSYNRGGSYVPDTTANAAISTSANSLALSQFAGAKAYTPMNNPSISIGGTGLAVGSCKWPQTVGHCTYVFELTVNASGGQGPYTYAWSVSATSGSWYNAAIVGDTSKLFSPDATAKTVNFTMGTSGLTATATISCTVTDASGAKKTASTTVSLSGSSVGGGIG